METNKDQPQSWIKYKSTLCQTCVGTCCTMPVEVRASDLVRLGFCDETEVLESPKKIAGRLIQDGIVKNYREKTELFTLQSQSNGHCLFLNKKGQCDVYEKRPGVCRSFPEKMGRRLGFCPYSKQLI